jgi:hypothetical protein
MKKFKDLLSEQIAADYKEKKDDEKEVKGYKPRSKGEEDFANMHTVDKVNHPVAEPEQHTGDRKGPKSDAGEDHDGPEKKGQELPMTYSQFMKLGGWGQSSARGADKSQGDMKPVMQGSSKVTESVELDEAVKPGNVKLKSGESVMLSKDDAEAINDAMKELNSSNKKKMQDELMKDKKSFMSMVKFAKTAA